MVSWTKKAARKVNIQDTSGKKICRVWELKGEKI